MIDTIGIFLYQHVYQHARRTLQTTHPYLAGCLALLVAYDFYGFGSHFSIDQNFALFQNYDAVIFGFTATAMAIMLTIASSSFLKFISSKEIDGRTAYRAAAFVLAWNSFVHSIAFFLVFVAKNSLLWENKLVGAGLTGEQHFFLFVVLWVQFYAFFQFVVTNLTLFEISDLFGVFLKRTGGDRPRE